MAPIETFGEAFSSGIVEAVLPPRSHDLLLHAREGRSFKTVQQLRREGDVFIARQIDHGLLQSVRFPPPSLPFGDGQELTASMCEVFTNQGGVEELKPLLLVAFSIVSWFSDSAPVAPVLQVFGPDAEVSRILRILSCFCRRPILFAQANIGSLSTLPRGLGATLILNQREMSERLTNVLLASNRRHFCIANGKSCVDLCGAKVFVCEDPLPSQYGLGVTISPSRRPLPLLTDSAEREIAQFFQPRLLRYRMLHYHRIRDANIDVRSYPGAISEEAWTWLAPIADFANLTQVVSTALHGASQDLNTARFSSARVAVAEALLHFCHASDIQHVLVGQVAEAANHLLVSRDNDPVLSARKVGSILRMMGISAERDARGFRIDLAEHVREHIHRLSVDYDVPSIDGTVRCRHCPDATEISENPNKS